MTTRDTDRNGNQSTPATKATIAAGFTRASLWWEAHEPQQFTAGGGPVTQPLGGK